MSGSDARALSRSLLDLCRMRKLTIATAESCTGGLVAGALTDIPGSSDVIYVGTVNGGIWKTTDAGTVWQPIFDGQPVGSIGALAVAPSDSNTIYAGTGESDIRSSLSFGTGMYKSQDAGKTWTHIGLEETRHISRR